jgi:hypothetical protein
VEKPKLKTGVKAIFIASEENSTIPGIGIEEMMKRGELEKFKNGPLFWGMLFILFVLSFQSILPTLAPFWDVRVLFLGR